MKKKVVSVLLAACLVVNSGMVAVAADKGQAVVAAPVEDQRLGQIKAAEFGNNLKAASVDENAAIFAKLYANQRELWTNTVNVSEQEEPEKTADVKEETKTKPQAETDSQQETKSTVEKQDETTQSVEEQTAEQSEISGDKEAVFETQSVVEDTEAVVEEEKAQDIQEDTEAVAEESSTEKITDVKEEIQDVQKEAAEERKPSQEVTTASEVKAAAVSNFKAYRWEAGIGRLTITGNTEDFTFNQNTGVNTPWFGYRDKIKSIVINNGVTKIGSYAFTSCFNATSVTIPGSVTSLGYASFLYCQSLKEIRVPASVKSVGNYAFDYCNLLVTTNGWYRQNSGAYTKGNALYVSGTASNNNASHLLSSVNNRRSNSLQLDENLSIAAQKRAAELSFNYSQTRPSGQYSSTSCLYADAEVAVSDYYSSPYQGTNDILQDYGSNKILMNNQYKSAGVGCFMQGGKYYYVVLLSTEKVQYPYSIPSANAGVTQEIQTAKGTHPTYIAVTGVYKGKSRTMEVRVNTMNDSGEYVKINLASFASYSSSKTKYIKVNSAGKMTAKKKTGTSTITMRLKNGVQTYSTKVASISKLSKPSVSLKAQKGRIVKISWKKNSKATGYYVYYSTKKNGKYKKVATIKDNAETYFNGQANFSGKKLYVKVYSYNKTGNKTIKSPASSVKSIKVKK